MQFRQLCGSPFLVQAPWLADWGVLAAVVEDFTSGLAG